MAARRKCRLCNKNKPTEPINLVQIRYIEKYFFTVGFRTAVQNMRTNAAERKLEIDGALERVQNAAQKSDEIVKTLGSNQEALSAQQTNIRTSQSESANKIADLEEKQKRQEDEIKNQNEQIGNQQKEMENQKEEMEKLKNELASLVDNQKNDQGNVQTTADVRLLTIYCNIVFTPLTDHLAALVVFACAISAKNAKTALYESLKQNPLKPHNGCNLVTVNYQQGTDVLI